MKVNIIIKIINLQCKIVCQHYSQVQMPLELEIWIKLFKSAKY
jgi:hypothetical protein